MRYPIEPLERWIALNCPPSDDDTIVTNELRDGRPSSTRIAERCNVSASLVRQWRATGLSEWAADKATCALGVHPAALWPSWFDDALEPEQPAPDVVFNHDAPFARLVIEADRILGARLGYVRKVA